MTPLLLQFFFLCIWNFQFSSRRVFNVRRDMIAQYYNIYSIVEVIGDIYLLVIKGIVKYARFKFERRCIILLLARWPWIKRWRQATNTTVDAAPTRLTSSQCRQQRLRAAQILWDSLTINKSCKRIVIHSVQYCIEWRDDWFDVF